ncbi:MAG TPA: neutral/alkaline non-lysosomal ceramidase N-terminal domain-containing protein [Bryobacteraceae bacterium]|jgi:hypothetical protein
MVGLTIRLAVVAALLASITPAAELRVGAAKEIVTPDLKIHGPVYMAGFGNNRIATGIHDDLYARCFSIDAGGPKALIICAVDSIGIFLDDVDRMRAAIAKDVSRADIVIAATHVHQGPDSMGLWGPLGKTGINETYMSFLTAQVAKAAVNAYQSMAPAKLTIAKTHPDELDTFIDDSRPPVRHDAELLAIRAVDSNGKTIATLINWANHPEALASKNTLITSDYVATLRTTVEAKLGGIAVYANGAIGGMQSPLGAHVPGDLKDGTFEKAIYIGNRVGAIAVEAIEKGEAAPVDAIQYREQRINVPLANKGFEQAMALNLYSGRKPLNKDGTTPSIVGAFTLINHGAPLLECALIPGEMYPELSLGGVEHYSGADFPDAPVEKPIKQMMTAPYRMLFGLANDEIGYIIPKAEWDNEAPWLNGAKKRWYGEVNSVGPDVAPTIANAVAKLFQ